MLTENTNFLTMHLEVIFQLLMRGPDEATTTVVYTRGMEIEFYPNLTPEWDL